MKLGLLGDIHGNHLALKAVLSAATSAKVTKLLVTGDLVGYYFHPLLVLELLSSWDKHMVRGNHEDMLVAARQNPEVLTQVDKRYGTGLRCAIEQLSTQQLDELSSLPHPLELCIDGCSTLLCHGSPSDIERYIYPDTDPDLLKLCGVKGFDLVVMGHTHYPMSHQIEKTLIVNPGSVGQPRNRKQGASWAVFDTEELKLEFRMECYDPDPLIRECEVRHPELPYLSEVLIRI